jgi:hypothetical protein
VLGVAAVVGVADALVGTRRAILSGQNSSTVIIPSAATYFGDVISINSLVGYWRMADSPGCSSLTDSASGSSHAATVIGGVTCGATGLVIGSPATSASFNGSTGAGQLSSSGETFFHGWDFNQAWTVEFLIKPNLARSGTIEQECSVFSKMQSIAPFTGFEVGISYQFDAGAGGARTVAYAFLINNFGGAKYVQVYGSTDLTNGSVWHVVVQNSGSGLASGISITVNGAPDVVTALKDTLSSLSIVNSIAPSLGSRNISSNFMQGGLQELAVYNSAANQTTPTLIATNVMSSGKPSFHYGLSRGRVGLSTIVRPNVILDTDISSDVDDVGDVALAAVLAKRGEIKLAGIITDSANDRSADAAYAIAKFIDGSGQNIVGAWQGSVPAGSPSSSLYTSDISTTFGLNQGRSSYSDGVQKYRSLLSSLPNNSVVIVGTGFSTTLDGLLVSSANAGGDGLPSGLSLINSKVVRLIIVMGCYPSNASCPTGPGSPEFNFVNGPAASASDLVANWPTEVVCIGIELAGLAGTNAGIVYAGPPDAGASSTSPVQQAFHDWGSTPRTGWGLLGVLFAARGVSSGIEPAGLRGAQTVNSGTGANTWSNSVGTMTYTRLSAAPSAFMSLFNSMYISLPAAFP